MRSLVRFGLWALLLAAPACKGQPDDTPWCSASVKPPVPSTAGPTYYKDVKPILDQKCVRCHVAGGIGPFPLTTYAEVDVVRDAVRASVFSRHMPPWLGARCCNKYFHDFSLTDDEISTVTGWADANGPGGNPADEPAPLPPIGGLSRVDVVVKMPAPYTPKPPKGSTDDLRCFVADWPFDKPVYVTGLNPVPGAREEVHHMVIAAIKDGSVKEVLAREGQDGQPGFDCSGGFGGIDLRDVNVLGGGLGGGDFPRGLGGRVEPGSKIVMNIHYSTVKTTAPDQTRVEFRIDENAAESKGVALANPAWLVGGAMSIPAGEKDAAFFFKLEPDLFTRDKKVNIQSIVPHMHYFGTKIVVRALPKKGNPICLLEIPTWHFGWEQPFWLEQPIPLGPDDDLYVECHFDNSAQNQPAGGKPRDIAWGGNNQDMCAAFVGFTDAE